MNDKIIEAIKIDNVDLFRLLFSYKKIKDGLQSTKEYDQLKWENFITRNQLGLPDSKLSYDDYYDYIITKKNRPEISDINISDLISYDKFIYLFRPSIFLDLCSEYNAYNIFKEYLQEIFKFSEYISGDSIEDYSIDNRMKTNSAIMQGKFDKRIEFLMNFSNGYIDSFPIHLWKTYSNY